MAREIKQTLYRINFYGLCNQRFVECQTLNDLYDYVAQKVAAGNICISVVEICIDGSTPKVSVMRQKEYKQLLRKYLDEQKRGGVV